ncbi:MAG: SDR family oxidoreductase [Sphingomonadales bacterium]|nr:SDR family oxidoreductase [Sphingomonadales bacterium]NCO49815.1 SDR family oxidoreductase [Sphingomonadales bacterium]NCO98640.1 SDR family oxidoreductase [Sphingomonadales bacterium]NCP26320.1 SDR family oxidoreductase [Sphingomonadales bacterium]NCP43223.1 SDR family oxidoreductase [Sphingomonadales bacterium]
MSRLTGKIAIVTGAGSGLGTAISKRFAEEGAQVVLTDIDLESATNVANAIGTQAIALHQDVADEQRWDDIVAATIDAFGTPHVLVNNAGLVIPGTIEDCSLEQFRLQNSIMLEGLFLGCRAAVKAMKSNDQPSSIINLSSMAALQGYSPFVAYSAAKGGVRSMTKSVALHCKEQDYPIRCNSLHPAGIDTPMVRQDSVGAGGAPTPETGMIPLGELGHPNDVAALCVYLASDESRFMTAGEYPVDNGALYKPA